MKWIKTSEELPRLETEVLVYIDGYYFVRSLHRVDKKYVPELKDGETILVWWGIYDNVQISMNDVDHWMPLPEFPV